MFIIFKILEQTVTITTIMVIVEIINGIKNNTTVHY